MSRLIRKSKKGFTLIELMIVVAIIGILAAIAIPNFLRFQLKSKSSEGKVNIAAIRTSEESYLAEFGNYVDPVPNPAAGIPGSQKTAFDNTTGAGTFDQLGWTPEGQVFFQYDVVASGNRYTVTAAADIDNNSTPQAWGYVKPTPGDPTTGLAGSGTGHSLCLATGVGAAQDQTSTVGPCDATSGQSKF